MADPHSVEVERIQKEYARRAAEIPQGFYSLEHAGNLYIYLKRFEAAVRLLERNGFFPLQNKKILDVGCGSGQWLLDFQNLGAAQNKLHGIDLLPERIDEARKKLPEAILRVGEASALPWPDRYFDLIVQSTVFTSILDPALKAAVANEMLRVLAPGGIILWYDFRFNNPWNSQVRGIGKSEIRKLFLSGDVKTHSLTLLPPLARMIAPVSWILCLCLEKIQFLNSHLIAVIRKANEKK
jgi:SAM-dependent methyltransferase